MYLLIIQEYRVIWLYDKLNIGKTVTGGVGGPGVRIIIINSKIIMCEIIIIDKLGFNDV